MMTAEQFWSQWDASAAAVYSAKNPAYWMKFAEAYAAAQLAEKEREIERLRFKLYHYAEHKYTAHTTACSIWREDGQGHAEGFEGDRGPCNCGCLENFQRTRAEAAEQRLKEAQAEAANHSYDAIMALRERLRQREAELEQLRAQIS